MIYVQVMTAQAPLPRMDAVDRAQIQRFAQVAPNLLLAATMLLRLRTSAVLTLPFPP